MSTDIAVSTPYMIARIEGAIGWMIFNNPERRNAVKAAMWEAIPAIMDRFEADPNVRVIVVRGDPSTQPIHRRSIARKAGGLVEQHRLLFGKFDLYAHRAL